MQLLEINELKFTLTMPKRVRERLKRTCFRPNHLARAGNFSLWESWEEIERDEIIGDALVGIVHDLLSGEYRAKETFSIRHPDRAVGWAPFAPMSYAYREGSLPFPRQIDSRTRVVQARDRAIPAPMTHILSFALRIEYVPRGSVPVIVENVCPGSEIGLMTGDLTGTGYVYFPPEHPGGSHIIKNEEL